MSNIYKLKRGTFALESAHCEGSGQFQVIDFAKLTMLGLA